jgi:glycosyltransferase involved in cell wall biosynthesis
MAKVRKILYVSHVSTLMGAAQALLKLLTAIDRSRYLPLVVLPADGPLARALTDISVPFHILPLSWWIPATDWKVENYTAQMEHLNRQSEALAALAASEKVDLIHTNTIVTMEGGLAAARCAIPHVWHSRGLFDYGFPPSFYDDQTFIYSIVDLLSDVILCVSGAVEKQAASCCRLAPRVVVHDGFDREQFLAQPVDNREKFCLENKIDPADRIISYVGGVQQRKGLFDLVEAAARLIPRFPRAVFAICGPISDPLYFEKVKFRIQELKITNHFRFLGFQHNVLNLLVHSELLVHPSLSEGFGLAPLEAMAAGKPVVATCCGGPEEIVEDGVTGFLTKVGEPEALVQAMVRLLSDPALSRSFGMAGANRARAFSFKATAHQTEGVYDTILDQGTSGSWNLPIRRRIAEFAYHEVLSRRQMIKPQQEPLPCEGRPQPADWLGRLFRRITRSRQ